jgi:glycyl-tRNA synthetase beta subunit
MVMDEDIAVRDNRIALINRVNQAFIATADISLIQS